VAFSLPFPAAILGTNVQGDLGPLTMYTGTPGRVIYFLRAPPKEPPSPRQLHVLAKWVAAANLWWSLEDQQRETWLLIARRAGLRITGYNLFVWWAVVQDNGPIQTLELQTGLSVLP